MSLSNFSESDVNFTDIAGTNFFGAHFAGVRSGEITGVPFQLPAPWQLMAGSQGGATSSAREQT